jgi:hypothetical protein
MGISGGLEAQDRVTGRADIVDSTLPAKGLGSLVRKAGVWQLSANTD